MFANVQGVFRQIRHLDTVTLTMVVVMVNIVVVAISRSDEDG